MKQADEGEFSHQQPMFPHSDSRIHEIPQQPMFAHHYTELPNIRTKKSKSPTMRNMPPWDDRAHVTFSKNNAHYHTQYKQFFDKDCGRQQYTDQFKYIYKTPSNGQRDFGFFDQKSKYYWEKRSPVSPRSQQKNL